MVTVASDNPFPSVLMVEGDPEALAANPASGQRRLAVGTDHLLYLVDDTGTKTQVGGGLTDPMTTRGDIIVRNASNVTARLAIGTSGKVLSSDGTDVSWQTPSVGSLASAKYKRTTGDYTTTSNTFVDVDATNLALTISTGARRVLVTLLASGYNTTANEYIGLDVDLDGTRMINSTFGLFVHSPSNEPKNLSFSILSDVLTAGSHTFKLQYRRNAAGTVTLYGTGNSYLIFSVMEQAG